MKSHGLDLLQPSQLPFSFYKSVLLPLLCKKLVCGLPWLQTLNCNSLLNPNRPIFAGEINGSLFIPGQQTSRLLSKLQPLAWCLAQKKHVRNVGLNSESRCED